jgi:hypothetical protein
VEEYWPRIDPEPSGVIVAPTLYGIRNSLVHDLGAHDDADQAVPRVISLAKHALDLEEIVTRLEHNLTHPLTVPVVERHADADTVHVSALYWALHRILQSVTERHADAIDAAIAMRMFPEFRRITD